MLGEKGAKPRTIMKILGHSSPVMSMTYIDLSDREVLREYQQVLGSGGWPVRHWRRRCRASCHPQRWTG